MNSIVRYGPVDLHLRVGSRASSSAPADDASASARSGGMPDGHRVIISLQYAMWITIT